MRNLRKPAIWTLAMALFVVLLRSCAATSYLIPSQGMSPTLCQGDRIVVNKWSYGLRLPFMPLLGYHRWGYQPAAIGDVVVFNNPANYTQSVISRREVYIGRCLGTPGDTLYADSLLNTRLTPDSALTCRPLLIPGRNRPVRVQPWNITLLRNTLLLHEHRSADIKGDTLYIDGKPVQHCCFGQDYYWIGADNPTNVNDSRLFGLVPQSHLIGQASLIWFSKEPRTGLFKGYHWERVFLNGKLKTENGK